MDEVTGQTLGMYFYKKTAGQQLEAEDTWKIHSILRHRTVEVKLDFLVWWEGGTKEDATWEPSKNFFQEYYAPLVDYAQMQGLGGLVIQDLVLPEQRGVRRVQKDEKDEVVQLEEEAREAGIDISRTPGWQEYVKSLR